MAAVHMSLICTHTRCFCMDPVFRQHIRVLLNYTTHSKEDAILMSPDTYNITGNSGVTFCNIFKVLQNFQLIFNGD